MRYVGSLNHFLTLSPNILWRRVYIPKHRQRQMGWGLRSRLRQRLPHNLKMRRDGRLIYQR